MSMNRVPRWRRSPRPPRPHRAGPAGRSRPKACSPRSELGRPAGRRSPETPVAFGVVSSPPVGSSTSRSARASPAARATPRRPGPGQSRHPAVAPGSALATGPGQPAPPVLAGQIHPEQHASPLGVAPALAAFLAPIASACQAPRPVLSASSALGEPCPPRWRRRVRVLWPVLAEPRACTTGCRTRGGGAGVNARCARRAGSGLVHEDEGIGQLIGALRAGSASSTGSPIIWISAASSTRTASRRFPDPMGSCP